MENASFNNNTDGEEAPFEFKNLLSEMFTSFPNQNPNTFFSSPNSSTSTNSSSSSQNNIISFGNPDSNHLDPQDNELEYEKMLMMSSNISTSSTTVAKRICRSPLQSQEHILAERKRRERFSHLFAVLAKTIPGLKKLDKASILEDAIKYIGELQERVSTLEEAAGTTKTGNLIESTSTAQKPHSLAAITSHHDNSFKNVDHESKYHDMKVQILDKNVLIGINCSKQMRNIFSIIAGIMEKLHLTIHHIRVAPSNHSTALHYISILAEIDDVDITVQDVEKAFELSLLSTPNLTQD
ncbi:hypothetical protein FXO38_24078 [Capsicum annuum]|nr:transcription factor bHLH18-like [Capsicum annuum]KAF3636599.1 hypothetical protein FXO38_24078 [Capsicum annuum]